MTPPPFILPKTFKTYFYQSKLIVLMMREMFLLDNSRSQRFEHVLALSGDPHCAEPIGLPVIGFCGLCILPMPMRHRNYKF